MLNDRKKIIEKGLKDAEEATVALEKANEARDEILKEATFQAEKIIEETKKSAEDLKDSMTMAAKSESDKIITAAREAAEIEFTNARANAEDIALELSRNIVDKILGEIFTKEEKSKIIARNIKRLEKYD